MAKLIDCDQGSAEWFQARCGRITGSRLTDVMAYLKSGKGEMKCRADYRMDLVAERLTGLTEDQFCSREMKWGTSHEEDARVAYEMAMDTLVQPVGFAVHPTMDYSGASADSLLEADGILEIKCPKTTTHLAYRMAGVVPEEYQPQMLWEMVCCECEWGHFVSYDPRLPADLRLFVVRFDYDEKRVAAMEAEVRKFNDEINDVIEKLRNPTSQVDQWKKALAVA